MIIGVPKEVKIHENRVGLVPGSVSELVARGHRVIVEQDAAKGIDISDSHYQSTGAEIANNPAEIYAKANLIVKVKEPTAGECKMLCEGQILFTYLHLVTCPVETDLLLASGCTAIAYETVTDSRGHLPLLSPMSEVAGRMSIQAGAHALEKFHGGRGILLGGVPGVPPANVVVLGGGVVGTNAICMAIGLEANVTVLDKSLTRLRELNALYGSALKCLYATQETIRESLAKADLVIGAVLIPGAQAPRLVSREMLKSMRPGAVIVDVAIDQGGCFETSKPTTHQEPTYIVDNIVHYCVTNMPGAVPCTSTFALNNATLPFVLSLAEHGIDALKQDLHLMNGLNIHQGMMTCSAVAKALGKAYILPEKALLQPAA